MDITLNTFKSLLPSQIVQRGRDYFRDGNVADLAMEEEGEWVAQVEGSDLYEVRVHQRAKGILEYRCTCPYEYGDVCKHIAATLYAIVENFPEYVQGKPRRKTTSKSKGNTRADKLRKVLSEVRPDQLITAVVDLAQKDRILYNNLMLLLGTSQGTTADYPQMIKDALKAGRKSYGMLESREAQRAGQQVQKILKLAAQLRKDGHPDTTLAIYQAVLAQVPEVLYSAQDSAGALFGCIEMALEGLRGLAEEENPLIRRPLFRYVLEQALVISPLLSDINMVFLRIAVDMAYSTEEREQVYATLAALEGGDNKRDQGWRGEGFAAFRYQMILQWEGETAALAFLKKNRHFHGIRSHLIETYLAKGDLDAAKEVAEEGLRHNPGPFLNSTSLNYLIYLQNIAIAQKDSVAIVNTTRRLFLAMRPFQRNEEYLVLLKQTVPAEEWPPFINRLIKEVNKDTSTLAVLYAFDARWDDLLTLAQTTREFPLELYQDALDAHFPGDMAVLYETRVQKLLEQTSDRGTYAYAADLLSRMKAMGKGREVQELIQLLKQVYPSRRAMIEELNRV